MVVWLNFERQTAIEPTPNDSSSGFTLITLSTYRYGKPDSFLYIEKRISCRRIGVRKMRHSLTELALRTNTKLSSRPPVMPPQQLSLFWLTDTLQSASAVQENELPGIRRSEIKRSPGSARAELPRPPRR